MLATLAMGAKEVMHHQHLQQVQEPQNSAPVWAIQACFASALVAKNNLVEVPILEWLAYQELAEADPKKKELPALVATLLVMEDVTMEAVADSFQSGPA